MNGRYEKRNKEAPGPDSGLRALTSGQAWILAAATLPMVGFALLGGLGTYTNINSAFANKATALGVVAAGEGSTLVLALVFVGLTMLGQPSPLAVRAGLWLLPAVASTTGAVVAQGASEAVVFAMTPMAMCVAAEGMGLLARRIVIHRTGVDMEAQRRNARTMQALAVSRAVAANHPRPGSRKRAELRSWRLMQRVGVGDTNLGAGLVGVQRERMTQGADEALAAMFTAPGVPVEKQSVTPSVDAGPGRDALEAAPVTETGERHTVGTPHRVAVTEGVVQVSAAYGSAGGTSVTDAVTLPGQARHGASGTTVTDREVRDGESVTDEALDPQASRRAGSGVTLGELASVAQVPVPVPGERLTDGQLEVVLRHLRYQDDPPLSYRQATTQFRAAGFVGSEERVRRVWGALMSKEETTTETPTAPRERDEEDQGADEGEEEPEDADA
ncbi:hypothetical protein [Streptomyces sp. NPDC001054]